MKRRCPRAARATDETLRSSPAAASLLTALITRCRRVALSRRRVSVKAVVVLLICHVPALDPGAVGERDKPWERRLFTAGLSVRRQRKDVGHARYQTVRTHTERVSAAGGGARRQSVDLAAPAHPRRHRGRRTARRVADCLRLGR